jgi:hypothetical protein
LPSAAITSRPPARIALVHSQVPSTSGLIMANARRNVDFSADRGSRPAQPARPPRRRRPAARLRRTTSTPRSLPRFRRRAARSADAAARASCAGPGPGQGDPEGTGCAQPGWTKMSSAGGCPSWQATATAVCWPGARDARTNATRPRPHRGRGR